MTAADVEHLAQLAYAEVLASKPRTPQRRAAVCLYVAATVPPARSVAAARRAVESFGSPATQRAALALLAELAITTEKESA